MADDHLKQTLQKAARRVRSGNLENLSNGQEGRGQPVILNEHEGINVTKVAGYSVNSRLVCRDGIRDRMGAQCTRGWEGASGLRDGQYQSGSIDQPRTQVVNGEQFIRVNIEPARDAIRKLTQLQGVIRRSWDGSQQIGRRILSSGSLKIRIEGGRWRWGIGGGGRQGGSARELGKSEGERGLGCVGIRCGR